MKFILNDVRGKRIELENKELCSACGGLCCKNMGCHYSPDDFSDLSFEGLKKEIDKGYISIDWWDYLEFESKEYEHGYFLRIRNKNAPIVDPSWGGVCILLTEDGCPLSFEGLKKEIDKGYISIDWWEYLEFEGKEYERGYFLRVRNEYAPIVDPSWGGVCILLTEDGCPLSFEERPKGARLLIPSVNKCKSLYTKEDCCIDWIKYHDILEDLHDYYLNK